MHCRNVACKLHTGNGIFEEELNRAKDLQSIVVLVIPYKDIEGACSQIEGFTFSKVAYSLGQRGLYLLLYLSRGPQGVLAQYGRA